MKELKLPKEELWQEMPPIPAEVVRKYCEMAIERINRRPYGIDTLQQYLPMLQLFPSMARDAGASPDLTTAIVNALCDAQDLLDEAEARRR